MDGDFKMPEPEEIILTLHAQKNAEKEKRQYQEAQASQGNYKAKKESIGGNVLLSAIIPLFFGFTLFIPTSGISIIIAIIGIIAAYGYYYGYKKGKRTREAYNVHYRCPHCNNTFTGPHKKCPHCGGSVSCDVHRYTCTRCGHKFIAKRNSCPNCGSNLYYN